MKIKSTGGNIMEYKEKNEVLQEKIDSICKLLWKQLQDINNVTEQAENKAIKTAEVPVYHQQNGTSRYR